MRWWPRWASGVGGSLAAGLLLAACNAPTFAPAITPLALATAPPSPVFGTVSHGTVQPSSPATMAMPTLFPTVSFDPAVAIYCPTDFLRIRESPSVNAPIPTMVLPGSEVTRLSGEALAADGHVWYQVRTDTGIEGWAASEFLRPGECPAPFLIEAPCVTGYYWDPDGRHYGVDLHSAEGQSDLYSPYSDRVVASDSCPACTEDGNTTGKHLGETGRADYNYGYGAMVVLEYPYEDLSPSEMQDLSSRGVSLQPGQSLYLMVAHLDPSAPILAAGAELEAEDVLATIGTSGNSDGPHAHIEAAIAESGLSPEEGASAFWFWTDTVVDRENARDRGRRIDPSELFGVSSPGE